jgi:hypothetical protein
MENRKRRRVSIGLEVFKDLGELLRCWYLLETQEKPLCNDVCQLDQKVKLSVPNFHQ